MDITVYCSSSDAVPRKYMRAAETLGAEMGKRGHTLIYGGASVGSMGAVARGVKSAGGRVVGVMPSKLHSRGLAFTGTDEEIITMSMRERKGIMEERAEGFIALPGGLGTLEEILEVMVLKQLGYHARPVVLIDIDGFYAPLLDFFERLYQESFMKHTTRRQYAVVDDPAAALLYLEEYIPPELEEKWFNPHPVN
jgi:cytokinin riboside 5'-monophosphate phosphoribohydrolase